MGKKLWTSLCKLFVLVSLSDIFIGVIWWPCRYVLPFSEVLDWNKASLVVDERQLFQLPYLLRGIPASKILSLRWYAQFMWDTYFSSVSKIVSTTLEV